MFVNSLNLGADAAAGGGAPGASPSHVGPHSLQSLTSQATLIKPHCKLPQTVVRTVVINERGVLAVLFVYRNSDAGRIRLHFKTHQSIRPWSGSHPVISDAQATHFVSEPLPLSNEKTGGGLEAAVGAR
ncbi:hypothetical protein EVAR_85656_1 [Eumeta japonica]|uniref:Uncharacterized protein n=1 Tax=Eumeta variegata TaxID=151549 RepID=A0A4C1XW58_EUMVA|nr:hypothetical protein EVAR_85656_1 [Eumeta japonica]